MPDLLDFWHFKKENKMKWMVLFLSLVFVSNVYAEKIITVTLTDEEYKAMQVLAETPEEWVQHAATNKAQKMIERLVEENSDLQPAKVSNSEKKRIIKDIDVVKEREKRHGK